MSIRAGFFYTQLLILNGDTDYVVEYAERYLLEMKECRVADYMDSYKYEENQQGVNILTVERVSGADAVSVIQDHQYVLGSKYMASGEYFLVRIYFSESLSLARERLKQYPDVDLVGKRELAKLSKLNCFLQEASSVDSHKSKASYLRDAKKVTGSLFGDYDVTLMRAGGLEVAKISDLKTQALVLLDKLLKKPVIYFFNPTYSKVENAQELIEVYLTALQPSLADGVTSQAECCSRVSMFRESFSAGVAGFRESVFAGRISLYGNSNSEIEAEVAHENFLGLSSTVKVKDPDVIKEVHGI